MVSAIQFPVFRTPEARVEALKSHRIVPVPDGWTGGAAKSAGQFREYTVLHPGGGILIPGYKNPVGWSFHEQENQFLKKTHSLISAKGRLLLPTGKICVPMSLLPKAWGERVRPASQSQQAAPQSSRHVIQESLPEGDSLVSLASACCLAGSQLINRITETAVAGVQGLSDWIVNSIDSIE